MHVFDQRSFFVYFIVFYSIVVQNLIYFFCLVSLQNKEDEIEIERNERRCFVDAKIIWNRFKCIFKTTKLIHCSFLHSNYIYRMFWEFVCFFLWKSVRMTFQCVWIGTSNKTQNTGKCVKKREQSEPFHKKTRAGVTKKWAVF